MPSSGDEERKISSQRGLDVHTPEAGEKPSKNDVMESKGEFQEGGHDQGCQSHAKVRSDED